MPGGMEEGHEHTFGLKFLGAPLHDQVGSQPHGLVWFGLQSSWFVGVELCFLLCIIN